MGELARLHASFMLDLLLQLCIKRKVTFLGNSVSIQKLTLELNLQR